MNFIVLYYATSQLLLLILVSATSYPYCADNVMQNAIPAIENTNLRLRQVQIVIRHGARTPWSGGYCWPGYSNDTIWKCNLSTKMQTPSLRTNNNKILDNIYTFEKRYVDNQLRGNCMTGQLLDEGYYQEISNGKIFQQAYRTALYPTTSAIDLTNTSDVYFESDDIPRTLMSGQLVISAMFPHHQSNNDTIIPWHTGDIAVSTMFGNSRECPILASLKEEWRRSIEFKSWNESAAHARLDKTVASSLGEPYNTNALFDCLLSSVCHGLDIPINKTTLEKVMDRYSETQARFYLYNQSFISKVQMTPLVLKIRNRIKEAVDGTASLRVALYSGHDTTIAPLLAAIGGPEWYPSSSSSWIPYAAFMSIELYSDNSTRNFFVRVLYQGKPLVLPGCSGSLCNVQAFMTATAFALNDRKCFESLGTEATEEAAPSVKSPFNRSLTPTPWLAISVLTLGLCASVAILVLCFVSYSRNSDSRTQTMVRRHPRTFEEESCDSPGKTGLLEDNNNSGQDSPPSTRFL